jgi:hypothetical protein
MRPLIRVCAALRNNDALQRAAKEGSEAQGITRSIAVALSKAKGQNRMFS